MEITELYYPRICARVGQLTLTQGIELQVCSDRASYADWAKIRFTQQYQPRITLTRKTPAEILLGYNNSFSQVFTGYVAKTYNGGSEADTLVLRDDALLLEDAIITNTFLETTPQEVLAFILSKAGVSNRKLSARSYPERRLLPIRKQSAVQAICTVNAAWGLSVPFFFSRGVFYWGETPEQEKVYAFEYGVNILSLDRLAGAWRLETVSAPFIRHSHTIRVTHPRVSGEFQVSRVVFSTNDSGFLRTHIYF